jgi:hypothetical protein
MYEGFQEWMWIYYTAMIMWKSQSPWPTLRGALYDSYLEHTGGYWGVRSANTNGLDQSSSSSSSSGGSGIIRVQLNQENFTLSIINMQLATETTAVLPAKGPPSLKQTKPLPASTATVRFFDPLTAKEVHALPWEDRTQHQHAAFTPQMFEAGPVAASSVARMTPSGAMYHTMGGRGASSGAMGTTAASSAAVQWPAVPENTTLLMRIELRLRDGQDEGQEEAATTLVARNEYWLSGPSLRVARNSGVPLTSVDGSSYPVVQVQNYSSLDILRRQRAHVSLKASATAVETKGATKGALHSWRDATMVYVNVSCPADAASLAFFIRLRLVARGSTRSEGEEDQQEGRSVLPVWYSDNYFSLLPSESKTVRLEYDPNLIAGGKVDVELSGWNAVTMRLPVRAL